MKKIALLALFLLLASSCLAEMVSVSHLPAELKKQPQAAGSTVIKQLPRYAALQVLEKGPAYLKVKDASGVVGYIHKAMVAVTPAVTITSKACNIRSGAGTEFEIVAKAKKGDSFKLLGQEQEWLQVQLAGGKTGWIWNKLVWGAK